MQSEITAGKERGESRDKTWCRWYVSHSKTLFRNIYFCAGKSKRVSWNCNNTIIQFTNKMISISRETQNSSKHSSLWMNSIKGKKAIKPYSNHSVSHIFARAKICRMRTPVGSSAHVRRGSQRLTGFYVTGCNPTTKKGQKVCRRYFAWYFAGDILHDIYSKWAVTQQPWFFFIRICTTCLVTYFHWNCSIICFLFCKSWLHRK